VLQNPSRPNRQRARDRRLCSLLSVIANLIIIWCREFEDERLARNGTQLDAKCMVAVLFMATATFKPGVTMTCSSLSPGFSRKGRGNHAGAHSRKAMASDKQAPSQPEVA
jgi:hypothetical protein